MKKILFSILLLLPVIMFTAPTIRDVTSNSDYYNSIVRMLDAGIMSLDNTGKFYGSNPVNRFELSAYGGKFIEYLEKNYLTQKAFTDINKRMDILALAIDRLNKTNQGAVDQNVLKRVENIETILSRLQTSDGTPLINVDSTILLNDKNAVTKTEYNKTVSDINNKLADILMAISPSATGTSKSEAFDSIAKNSEKVARETAIAQTNKIFDNVDKTIKDSREMLTAYDDRITKMNIKLDQTVRMYENILSDNEQRITTILKKYVDQKINSETDKLRTEMKNIADLEVGGITSSVQASLTQFQNMNNSYIQNMQTLYQKFTDNTNYKLDSFDARMNAITDRMFTTPLATQLNTKEFIVLKSDIEGMRIDFKKLEHEISNLNNLTGALVKLSEVDRKTANLSSDILYQAKRIDALEKVAGGSQSDVAQELQKKIGEIDQRVAQVQSFLANYSDKMKDTKELNQAFVSLQSEYDSLTASMRNGEMKTKSLQENVARVEARMNSIAALLNIDDKNLQNVYTVAELSDKFSNLDKRQQETSQQVYQADYANKVLDKRIATLEEKFDSFNINATDIEKLMKDYDVILYSYYDLKAAYLNTLTNDSTEMAKNFQKMKSEVKQEIRVDMANNLNSYETKLANVESKMSDLEYKTKEIAALDINKIKEAQNVSVQTSSNTQEIKLIKNDVDAIKKQAQQVDLFWATFIAGSVGVIVGAGFVWLIQRTGF